MVANVRTRWLALRSAGRVLPVTVNDGEIGGSYVCLPHSAYALYGRRELELVDTGAMRPLLSATIALGGGLLRAAGINRIVHVDNWLLATNLHGDWDGADLPALRRLLVARFPDHLIAVRSVEPWSSPELDGALRADGWTMLPSRQVWVTDDLAHQWRPRNCAGNDCRALARSGLRVEAPDTVDEPDAHRIAELYRMLYVDKYSALNPVFTPAWIAMAARIGLLRYRVARAPSGEIMGVMGALVRGGVTTPSVVGYDTGRPRREALYPIVSWLIGDHAHRHGLRLHGSAGAAAFKRQRGARPVIECTAVWTAHLPRLRRAALAALEAFLWRVAVPVMRARQL
jgi:hypothetical protein